MANPVHGTGNGGIGVHGTSNSNFGVHGRCFGNNTGVVGESAGGTGVHAQSNTGIGLFARSPRLAGRFEGVVEVTGDVRLTGADCAEEFDVSEAEAAEPGTVMVIDQEGTLKPSEQPYDKRVAGVVFGGEGYKPGIILDKQKIEADRIPVALMGRVACKVDAGSSPIEVGDLLTTSFTPGHAMKANDALEAFGAVLGKALRPLEQGQGMVPILVALQ